MFTSKIELYPMRLRRNLAIKVKIYIDVVKKKKQQKDASSDWSTVSAELY